MPVETVDRLAQELSAESARVRADVDDFFGQLLGPTGDSRDSHKDHGASTTSIDCGAISNSILSRYD